MSRKYGWRDIFRYTKKQKTPVQVGEKYEDLTGTQATRFEELTQFRQPDPAPAVGTALRKTRYTLAEASDSLNISEEHLLQQAASGSVNCYIDASGLKGRWHRNAIDGRLIETSTNTLTSGYLALTARSCKNMVSYGSINVSSLAFRCPSDAAAVNLDSETMARLSAEGKCDKYFCLQEPLWVDRGKVVLLAPLPGLAV